MFVFISGLIYAELGTRMPRTGGEYNYIARTFGPFAGFMFGWGQLFIVRTSASAGLALIVADYLGYFLPLNRIMHMVVALSVVGIFGMINYIGIQHASRFQKISTILKVVGILSIVIGGIVFSHGTENLLYTKGVPIGDHGPVGNVVTAMMLVIFAHTGWERVGYSAGEMKNPKRVIPLSLLIGIVIVVILYVSTNAVYHRTLGMEGMRNSTIVAADVLTQLIGHTGAALISVLVIISASGSINGNLMTSPRVYYAMARDGLFFRWLDHIHPRFRTPSRSVAVHCLWAGAILIIRGTFETIATGLVFTILIFYGLSTLSLFWMRRDDVGGSGIFRVPFYPVLPALSLLMIVGLIVLRAVYEWQKSVVDLVFIVTGIPFALFWCRSRRRPAHQINSISEKSGSGKTGE